jgi:hypothetical protein
MVAVQFLSKDYVCSMQNSHCKLLQLASATASKPHHPRAPYKGTDSRALYFVPLCGPALHESLTLWYGHPAEPMVIDRGVQ